MALVNQTKREINAKIVFFGPGLSGKSTNLKHIHGKLKPDFRSSMKAMSVQDARMLFFDFTPPGEGNVQGFRVRFHVYTVSGEVVDPAAWKMVLKGVDGVVFVADAHPSRTSANQQSLEQLAACLKGYGQSLSSLPVVLQYNKCDLPEALPVEDLDLLLNPSRLPSFRASSQSGEGVLQTLLSLVKSVLTELRGRTLDGGAPGEGGTGAVEPPPAAPAAPEPEPEPAAVAPPRHAEEQAEAWPPTEPGAAAAPAAAAAQPEEELSLEITGPPQGDGPGRFRLPLTLRSGDRQRTVTLSIALSLEEE